MSATTGLKGEVRLRPLSRYCDDYIREKQLSIGISPDTTNALILEDTSGMGKKMRFKFEGINSIEAAEKMIGQIVYASANNDDLINLVDSALLDFNRLKNSTDSSKFDLPIPLQPRTIALCSIRSILYQNC